MNCFLHVTVSLYAKTLKFFVFCNFLGQWYCSLQNWCGGCSTKRGWECLTHADLWSFTFLICFFFVSKHLFYVFLTSNWVKEYLSATMRYMTAVMTYLKAHNWRLAAGRYTTLSCYKRLRDYIHRTNIKSSRTAS